MRMTRLGKGRAAIYARISDARNGETQGVDRQVEDCEALAQRAGLTVVGTFVDNNVKAYGRALAERPAGRELLAAIADGRIDVVLAYSAERLYRMVAEIDDLVDQLKDVPVETVVSGEVDLSTADGRVNARLRASIAQHESEKRGERVARAARQRAEQGKFGGGVRRFGYNAIMTEVVPDEADAIAWAYRAVADGVSIRAVQREWLARGLKGTQGGQIATQQVTQVLKRPFNAGLNSYKGELLPGQSQVPPIVDEDLWRTVNAILADPARRTAPMGRPTVTLLAGILTCGVCGAPMYRQNQRDAARQRKVYTCNVGRHVARRCDVMEDGMTALLRAFLVDNAAKLRKPVKRAKSQGQDIAAQADQLRRKLEDLSQLVASGDLDARDYARATKDVRARLEALDAQVIADSARPASAALASAGDVGAAWDDADAETKRAVMKELLDSVVVDRVPEKGKPAGMSNVTVKWKDL